jgi:SAM-dependent methyltransferase
VAAPSPHTDLAPSSWVTRFGDRVRAGGAVLDVACGQGRHARWFAARGHPVEAVDRDATALANLRGVANVTPRTADLEGGAWPYAGRRFAAVVVTNYLHRPLFPALLDALDTAGVLLYETFADGNQAYGRPSNPDFLLRRGELLEVARNRLQVLAYEDLPVNEPRPAVIQRICAVVAPV